ncbi:uncharacterized protein LOC142541771 [Primulina tabacum]|uniref:uncharacterized protein LOC142541771 n=1 Tax=Primulina tabacum TaxID=48773 RepID=UPI003F592D2F
MAKGNQANQAPNHAPIGSGNRTAIDDSGSPFFFLQNGDHPGLILVSHPLSGINYNTWNRAMSMALTAKNKLSFVDNSIQRPPLDDLLYGAWLRCNSMVISWILNFVTKEIADSLMYIPTAHGIWSDLRDRFHQSNAPRIFQIKKLLSGLQQGSMDVTTYYTRLRTLWDELKDFQPVFVCNCGSMKDWIHFQNQECVMQFLMGLNESYAQICAQILMMNLIPIISKTFSLIVQEERQRSIQQDNISFQGDSTPVTRPPNISAVKSFSNVKGNRYDRLVCSHCEGVVDTPWINATTFRFNVTLPNGLTIPVSHIGTVCLSMHLVLHNVLFVPQFRFKHEEDDWDGLGHPSLSRLSVIGRELHLTPVKDNLHPCSVCHFSKQKRLHFPSNNSMCASIFDLVHIDIWGPFHPISIEGY